MSVLKTVRNDELGLLGAPFTWHTHGSGHRDEAPVAVATVATMSLHDIERAKCSTRVFTCQCILKKLLQRRYIAGSYMVVLAYEYSQTESSVGIH